MKHSSILWQPTMGKKTHKECKKDDALITRHGKEKCCGCGKFFRKEKLMYTTDPLYFLYGGEYDPTDKDYYCTTCHCNRSDEV